LLENTAETTDVTRRATDLFVGADLETKLASS
jgi:hypothetical protein